MHERYTNQRFKSMLTRTFCPPLCAWSRASGVQFRVRLAGHACFQDTLKLGLGDTNGVADLELGPLLSPALNRPGSDIEPRGQVLVGVESIRGHKQGWP